MQIYFCRMANFVFVAKRSANSFCRGNMCKDVNTSWMVEREKSGERWDKNHRLMNESDCIQLSFLSMD